MDETWSCPLSIGVLLHLTTKTFLDRAPLATAEAAHFSQDQKKLHAATVKTIIRCSHWTSDKGRNDREANQVLGSKVCVEVSFAGNCGVKPDESPFSVKSLTGIIIFLAGCPLRIWKSQLWSSVARSAFCSKHAGLCHSMRILIPLSAMLLETVKMLGLPAAIVASKIHCCDHEDNATALFWQTPST